MQKKVGCFIDKYDIECGAEARYIDLVSEIGELGKEILKRSEYGKKAFINSDDVENEIGDCLFSLLALCCSLDINADKALQNALNKYAARFNERGGIGSRG